jgi:hypothetical protein
MNNQLTISEIKKELYKQKPDAKFLFIRKGIAYYDCKIKVVNRTIEYERVFFNVPISDMGDSDFLPVMQAQLLNRWIVTN